MKRLSIVLVNAMAAMAQDPGQPLDIAAAREQAYERLKQMPPNSPGFDRLARSVANFYENGGFKARARVALDEALARAAPLGDDDPKRIALLNELAQFWEQDGNLLKSAGYLEQAAAALAPERSQRTMQAYICLALLDRKLGRSDKADAVEVTIRDLRSVDPSALAAYYEAREQFADAAEVYRKMAEDDLPDKPEDLEMAAKNENLLGKYSEAAAVMEEAIAVRRSAPIESGDSEILRMEQIEASYLASAGILGPAARIFRLAVERNADSADEPIVVRNFAGYLAETERAAQGISVLEEYLTKHPGMDAEVRLGLLQSLAEAASTAGDAETSERYRREASALELSEPQSEPGVLEQAVAAASRKGFADAYHLANEAIAGFAQDGVTPADVASVHQIASLLAKGGEAVRAEQLFGRLTAAAENFRGASIDPLIAVTESYARFLMDRPERWSAVPGAIERHRQLLEEASGPDSGTLAEPLRMLFEFAKRSGQPALVESVARDLLTLQESLSGAASEQYQKDFKLVHQQI